MKHTNKILEYEKLTIPKLSNDHEFLEKRIDVLAAELETSKKDYMDVVAEFEVSKTKKQYETDLVLSKLREEIERKNETIAVFVEAGVSISELKMNSKLHGGE